MTERSLWRKALRKRKGEVAQMLGKETEVDDAMEGILTQITIGNGSKWHDVYLDVPKDKKAIPGVCDFERKDDG